jgi:DNA-directed RNA polymerase specialized sigma24 family protein
MVMKVTVAEIAAVLKVSQSTVNRWQQRLRDRLRPVCAGRLPLLDGDEV